MKKTTKDLVLDDFSKTLSDFVTKTAFVMDRVIWLDQYHLIFIHNSDVDWTIFILNVNHNWQVSHECFKVEFTFFLSGLWKSSFIRSFLPSNVGLNGISVTIYIYTYLVYLCRCTACFFLQVCNEADFWSVWQNLWNKKLQTIKIYRVLL